VPDCDSHGRDLVKGQGRQKRCISANRHKVRIRPPYLHNQCDQKNKERRIPLLFSSVAADGPTFAHWTLGRLVCLGDSMHKMTPNSGTGGITAIESAAIESAASLANVVYRFKTAGCGLSPSMTEQVETVLKDFESGMKMRASEGITAAADVTLVQTLRSLDQQLNALIM
jgi:hypothetical protein